MPNIPFWDEAKPGEHCVVPCWPETEDGDGFDCPALLAGAMGDSGLFVPDNGCRAFNPGHVIWLCPLHGDNGIQTLVSDAEEENDA